MSVSKRVSKATAAFSLSSLTIVMLACSIFPPRPTQSLGVDKVTYHNDSQRTGWNPHERVLTPETVSSDAFGPIWQSPQFDFFGTVPPRLFASPLYVDRVKLSTGEHQGKYFSVLYAVTTTAYVYAVNAFDAADTRAGAILWRTRLTDSPCGKGTVGNLSTPVIDLSRSRLYVTSCDDAKKWQVHALDLGSGQELSGWPVDLNHSTVNSPGINRNGNTSFTSEFRTIQRGALNLSPDLKRLYIAFGLDLESGWLLTVDTVHATVASGFPATAVTEERQGGMWASGGPSVDEQGNVHLATGANFLVAEKKLGIAGVFPDSKYNWGQSILQLADTPEHGLKLTGTYSPFNYCQASAADIDLGSSGTIVIDLDPSTTATPHLLALIGGKQGNAYLLDRTRMPGSLEKRQACSTDSTSDESLLSPKDQPQFGRRGPINVFGPYSDQYGWYDLAKSRSTGAYFRSEAGSHYLFGTGSSKQEETSSTSVPPGLARLKIVTEPGKPAYLDIDQLELTQVFKNPGSPVITSNGGRDAIVWVLDANAQRTAPLYGLDAPQPVLHAFDALTLKLLWRSASGELQTSGKYNEPTVVKGAVFVGTDRIQAFGLRSSRSGNGLASTAGFTRLFDGRTLNGWTGDKTLWSVEDGAITGKSSAPISANTFLIHKGTFRNFELRFSYRFLTAQGNSGFQYRSRRLPQQEFSVAGYQANVATPEAKKRFAMLWDEDARGLLAYLGENVQIEKEPKAGIRREVTRRVNASEEILNSVRPYPAWNEYVVIAYHNRLIHAVNGLLAVDAVDNDADGRAMEGLLALQFHGGPPMGVQFKDIEIKEFRDEPVIAGRFAERHGPAEPERSATEPQVVSVGQKLYELRCAICHSANQPGIPSRERLATLSQDRVVQALMSGAMQAQAFGLSTQEINALATYLAASASAQ